MKYDAMYFLKKFDKIPESKWAIGDYKDDHGRKCALGYCGVRQATTGDQEVMHTQEGYVLQELFNTIGELVSIVNDGALFEDVRFLGDTPKEWIMNALLLINAGVKI